MRAKSRNAFTYIEMLVVVMIVLLAATLLLPNLPAIKESRDRRLFKSRLATMAAAARSTAIEESATVALSYEGESHTFRVTEERPNLAPRQLDVLTMPSVYEARKLIDDQYESVGGEWRVTFGRDGSCSGGGIEFHVNTATCCFFIGRGDAPGTWLDGELPDLAHSRWSAGGYEKRA